MEIHREMGTILGGVHLELTGEVNEEGFSVVGPVSASLLFSISPFHLHIPYLTFPSLFPKEPKEPKERMIGVEESLCPAPSSLTRSQAEAVANSLD